METELATTTPDLSPSPEVPTEAAAPPLAPETHDSHLRSFLILDLSNPLQALLSFSPRPTPDDSALPENLAPVLTFQKSPEGDVWDCIVNFLAEKKVVFGIDEKAIRKAISQWLATGEAVEVKAAVGEPPTDSQDAALELLIQDKKYLGDPDQPHPIDHRDRGNYLNIRKGTLLARATPPLIGKPGLSVHGEELAARVPAEASVEITPLVGKNTYENGVVTYEALDDAMLMECSVMKIDLVDTVSIKHDIDYHVGNIEAYGSVTIQGSVTSGFQVKARKNIEVSGLVENAYLEAGGKVKIVGGIVGKSGSTTVRCGGDFEALFVENARITSGGKVVIADSVVNSEIIAEDEIKVIEKKGVVITSRLLAGTTVAAKIFGSPGEGTVHLIAGTSPTRWQRVMRIMREKAFLHRQHMRGFMAESKRAVARGKRHLQIQWAVKNRTSYAMERLAARLQKNMVAELKNQSKLPFVWALKKFFRKVQVNIGPYEARVNEETKSGLYVLDLEQGKLVWVAQ